MSEDVGQFSLVSRESLSCINENAAGPAYRIGFHLFARIAHLVERLLRKQQAFGSRPDAGANLDDELASLGGHRFETGWIGLAADRGSCPPLSAIFSAIARTAGFNSNACRSDQFYSVT